MVSASVIGIETVGVAQLKDTARQLIEKATRFVQYIGYRYKNTAGLLVLRYYLIHSFCLSQLPDCLQGQIVPDALKLY